MNILTILLLLFLFDRFLEATSFERNNPAEDVLWDFLELEERLTDFLFQNYSSDRGAVFLSEQTDISKRPPPLQIGIDLHHLKLIGVSWVDARFRWNPLDYSNISYILVPVEKVWLPQFQMVNTHELKDFREDSQKLVRIYPGGEVRYYIPQVAEIICNMDVSLFPFDSQRCQMVFMSNLYPTQSYNVTMKEREIFLIPGEKGTGEWSLTNVTVEQQYVTELDVRIDRFVLTIKRHSSFYVSLIVIPSFIINLLSVLGMFISRTDKMGKLTIALTNLMSTTFILGILNESVPKTKNLSLLAIYVLVNMLIISLAVFATIVIPAIYLKYKRTIRKADSKENNDEHLRMSSTKFCHCAVLEIEAKNSEAGHGPFIQQVDMLLTTAEERSGEGPTNEPDLLKKVFLVEGDIFLIHAMRNELANDEKRPTEEKLFSNISYKVMHYHLCPVESGPLLPPRVNWFPKLL